MSNDDKKVKNLLSRKKKDSGEGQDDGDQPNMQPGSRIPRFFWTYIIIFAAIMIWFWWSGTTATSEITWNEFEQEMLASDDVEKIDVINMERAEVYIHPDSLGEEQYTEYDVKKGAEGPQFFFNIGSDEVFHSKLEAAQKNVPDAEKVVVTYSTEENWFGEILSWLLPIALIIIVWLWIMRRAASRMQGGMGNMFNFGQSKAKVYDKGKKSPVSFDDVAGMEEAKEEIYELVKFLKNPEKFQKLGARIPKGVLLVGPPGTGKTLLAKAVAGEAEVPFYSLSGSEFIEMFVGVGASRMRDLFEKAKKRAPSIIFIDEIDTIGRARGKAAAFQQNDERESTLNQLLAELDGFETDDKVIVIGATNRGDILDKALLRPGRFDRHIHLELPNKEERVAIFKVHIKKIVISDDVDIDLLASQTPGFSGADIMNICNEAALIAARRDKEKVDRQDFMDAIDRVIGGLEKKSKVIKEDEKERIALHEAGHVTTSWFLEHAHSVMKVTIVPRGKSLGAAWYLPEEHSVLTRTEFLHHMSSALGGRAAEELFFNEVSSNALDDLEKVTKQAYAMVVNYGLSDKLKNLSYYDSTGESERSLHKPYSERTAQIIDDEVQSLVNEAYELTMKTLKEHKDQLQELGKELKEREVLHKEELEKILGQRKGE